MRTEPSRSILRPSADALRAEWPELSGPLRRAALRTVMLTLGRLVRVEGAERLAAVPEPAIFALNHSNAVEAILAPCVLIHLRRGRLLHFLADWMYLHVPIVGWLIRQCEPIPVYGKPVRWRIGEAYRLEHRRRESVVEACLGRLAAGGSLGLFPEGTRNPDPSRLGRGRGGLGEIVLRSAAPVVPVGLHYPAATRLGRAPHLGRLVLRIGEPLSFEEERTVAERNRREAAKGWSPASWALSKSFPVRPLNPSPSKRFMIVPRYRRNIRVVLRLMRAAILEVVDRGYTHFLTDVFEDDPHSPLRFHTQVLGSSGSPRTATASWRARARASS